jgi:hypothetical protein
MRWYMNMVYTLGFVTVPRHISHLNVASRPRQARHDRVNFTWPLTIETGHDEVEDRKRHWQDRQFFTRSACGDVLA